jgi:hypothetical protein
MKCWEKCWRPLESEIFAVQKLTWIIALVIATVIGVLAQEVELDARPALQTDREHTQWIQQVMRSMSIIKPGLKRKDLLQILTEDGGSTRSQGRYVYKHCPYIKVDVQFSSVNEGPKPR